LMVGGAIPGETKTVSIAIYDKVQSFDTSGAGALSMLLLGTSLIAIAFHTEYLDVANLHPVI